MIEIKVLSTEGMCLRDGDIAKLKKGRTYNCIHEVLGNIGKAKVCDVLVGDTNKGEEQRHFLADVKTGSLYDPKTMRCITGPLELK